ncbi:MAG: Smr/MutS family protein [Pseudomonadota bacterium]|nr:Smr/MutS family protein [Pseudomonadota bacterium]
MRRTLSRTERRLWRLAMRDVVPLSGEISDSDPDTARSAASAAPIARAPVLSTQLLPPPPPRPLVMGAEGHTPGLDRRTDRRLRRGQLTVDVRIDLHGHGLDGAYSRLRAEIETGWRQGHRVLLVVTGRGRTQPGGGALRQAVPRWLAEPPLSAMVLAWHPARGRDGGDGALYILLRKRR